MAELNQYYEILGLQPGASQADVKQAYRMLAKTWHPDRFAHDPQLKQQAEERFKDINLAYQRLKDYQPGATPTAPTKAPSAPSSRPSGVSSRPSGAEKLYEQGAENVKAGRYKDALDDFSAAIRLNPHYAEAYRYRGFVHSLLGFELGAEADLKKAKELGLGQSQGDNLASEFTQQARKWWGKGRSTPPPPPPPSSHPKASAHPPVTWRCGQVLNGHRAGVTGIAISRDGKVLASSGSDGHIYLWNLRTAKLLTTLTGHSGPVHTIAISTDGQLLVSGSDDQTIKLWHVRTGEFIRTLAGHTGAVRAIAISPDRHLLVSGSQDGTVRIWNLSSGKLLYVLDEHAAPIWAVALSADGRMILSGGEDSTIKLHQLRTGELLRKLTSNTTVFAAAMSSNNRHFITGDSNCQIKLWDDYSLVTGSPVGAFAGHTGTIQAVAFSPDGQHIASGSDDHTIKLWHIDKTLLATLTEHTAPVTAVAFMADGRSLISGSSDKTIRIWHR